MMAIRSKLAIGKRRWASRVAWLVGIWGCSVAVLALAAWLMKMLFRAVGLA